MKNKLTDLNDHLFAALERLNDEDLKDKDLKDEIARGRAIASVGKEIVNNTKVVLEGEQFKQESFDKDQQLPAIFGAQQLEVLPGGKG